MAQKDFKLNFLAETSKKDNTAMMTVSILGAFFLPCTFIVVSLSRFLHIWEKSDRSKFTFGTGFFNFTEAAVPLSFWRYLALTIPLTLIILAAWRLSYRKRA